MIFDDFWGQGKWGSERGLGCLRFLSSLYKSWRLVRVGVKVVADKVKEDRKSVV